MIFMTCLTIRFLNTFIFRKELIFAFSGGLPVYIVGIVLAALSIWSFFMVGITDPGVVPKSKACH